MSETKTTTDHGTIREWAEQRYGYPARVAAADEGGQLQIDFGEPDTGLEEISWDQFFRIFDENDLAFLYQDRTESGGTSQFCRFVDRDADPKKQHGA